MLKRKRFGLIGRNIDYSFSRQYFSKKFKKENLTNCEYVNYDINHINDFKKIKISDYCGFNVTIPFKVDILKFLDIIDKNALKIGAVNTIKIKNNLLQGYNTDYLGFLKTIEDYNFNKAAVFGSGGASKAVCYALDLKKIPYLIYSRKSNPNFLDYSNQKKHIPNCDLIVNTTPLGTFPKTDQCPPINFNLISKKSVCYDLIYNPRETKFLLESKSIGAKTINGLKMLENQAEESWRIWNG
ncbi:MAG: shikimate dehydrogenase [Rickettsiales bacterium]|nr:shikimate dehydrogenase [Rickettsiales bacterium]